MATEEITISELELADEILGDMNIPVDTATETRAVTLKQLRAWLGSSLPTGFIIPAVGKISDGRFTLLDGKTLSREGTYLAFCNKVVSEVQAGNWFACSEEEYAQDIANFGQCGKFVVSNDYVRIPTITRFIGATVTLSEIGKTYKESLPNINGYFNISGNINKSGAFYATSAAGGYPQSGTTQSTAMAFSAYRSSSTYQDGAKVQPDHTKYPYYMVISTEGQTASVEIDINKVYEDMNLKANTNLLNLTAEGKSLASGFGMPAGRYIDLTLGASGAIYTAPANGWVVLSKKTSATNQYVFLSQSPNQTSIQCWCPLSGQYAQAYIPVIKGCKFTAKYSAGGDTEHFRFIYAEGEN